VTKTALLLSGRFGKGHDTVAEACAVALVRRGVEAEIVDSIALLGERRAKTGEWVFRRLLSMPPVYDAFHFSQLRTGARLGRGADGAALRNMYPRFRDVVDRIEPELVLSVFATGAAAGSRLKQERPEVVTAVFMTDSFAHRLWVHDHTDLFLVTSELAAASVRRFRPDAVVEVIEAPARPAFYDPPTVEAARAALGIPVEGPCALVMSGSWGIGPLDGVARALAASGVYVIVVAGTNERLMRRLRAAAKLDPRIMAFGYTDRIAELMAASDVVLTSSGDTCREARVVGRPLVLFDVVPGHGRENLMHELELGNAWLAAPEPASVVAIVHAVLERRGTTAEPVDAGAWEHGLINALERVGVTFEPLDGR
jgi:processive 1,2-diacylglycerol beta-glucosyltransferase